MRFTPAPIHGSFVIDIEPIGDDRGFFARAFCRKEFEAHGIDPFIAQCNISTNRKAGTLRGMHYQAAAAAEPKLVRCTKGAIYDAIIDMRPESPTYLQHFGIELTEDNHTALYVPGVCAHGYQALSDSTEIFYMVGEFYTPGHEQGLRYDDPYFSIDWPMEVTELSDKDLSWPLFDPRAPAGGQR